MVVSRRGGWSFRWFAPGLRAWGTSLGGCGGSFFAVGFGAFEVLGLMLWQVVGLDKVFVRRHAVLGRLGRFVIGAGLVLRRGARAAWPVCARLLAPMTVGVRVRLVTLDSPRHLVALLPPPAPYSCSICTPEHFKSRRSEVFLTRRGRGRRRPFSRHR